MTSTTSRSDDDTSDLEHDVVMVEGAAVGQTVRCGERLLFFTVQPELMAMDGQMFADRSELDRSIASRLMAAAGPP